MLMECLAAGRAISLPSSNVGMAKLAVRGTERLCRGAAPVQHADRQVRRRAGSRSARMGGQPVRDGRGAPACGGGRSIWARSPRSISAIAKYHVTERARADRQRRHGSSLGGKGICMGPSQFPRARLSADPDRDHRRRREHPDAQPDHLRPGRDPLPSLHADAGRVPRRRKAKRYWRDSTRPCSAISRSCCATRRGRWCSRRRRER